MKKLLLKCIAVLVLAVGTEAKGATLTWDANGATAGQTDGAGVWLGANQWWDGSANATWSSGNDAVFGNNGAAGNVTLASLTTVNSLTLNCFVGTYNLGTSGQTITLNAGITKNASSAGVAGFLGPTTLGGPQTWLNNSVWQFTMPNGANLMNNNGHTLTIDGTGIFTFGSLAGAASTNVTMEGSGGLIKNGPGRLTLAGANSNLTGPVSINGGVVVCGQTTLACGAGNLTLNGGVYETYYGPHIAKTNGTGAGEIQITGGRSGFSEIGDSATIVKLNNDAAHELVWGIPVFNPSELVLQTEWTAGNASINFQNKIDLNGATRTVRCNKVLAGTGSATISGVIRTSTGTAGLIKTGPGRLILTGVSTYDGGTTVSEGTLQFSAANTIAGSGRNVTVARGASVAAGYAIDNSFLNRIVETSDEIVIALGAASANSLDFSSSAGATLPNACLGASGSTATFTYSGASVPLNGTTYRLGGGHGMLSVSVATLTGSGNSLVVGIAGGISVGGVTLTGNNTYTGTTTLKAGTLGLSGNGAIAGSTAIALNGGGITLTSADNDTEATLDRIGDSAPVAVTAGGVLTYTTTTAASTRNFSETLGAVTVSAGQFDVVQTLNKTAGSQTLTLGGLAKSGTATVTFSSPALNATYNMIKVTGASATPAGQIIGPWATMGTTASLQTDYAKYDASANVLAAGIGASAQTTWTTAANAYTLSASTTLTATRTITALRYSGGNGTLTLASGCDLQTLGLLYGGTASQVLLVVPGTGGVLTTPSGANNLYLTTGTGGIAVTAPVNDNGGALTLVKSGSGGALVLAGTIGYSGDTVVNAGTLQLCSANANNDESAVRIAAIGATLNLNFTGTDTVKQLFIGGTEMPKGLYGAGEIEINQITGTGKLNVTGPPPAGTLIIIQ